MRRKFMIVTGIVALAVWCAGAAGAATTWVVQATPNPAGSNDSFLTGTSCPSAARCTAVGWYLNSSVAQTTLAEHWNGSKWAIQATPNPAGSAAAFLEAVSCASAASCTAVGFSGDGSGANLTLAEHWNGTAWSIQATPNPSGATSSSLYGVSCTSATSCTAVGWYESSAPQGVFTLAEHWNGSTWAIQSTPSRSGSNDNVLSAVSCATAASCTAVGYDTPGNGRRHTLAEHWDGSTWSIQATPSPAGVDSTLDGVSCAAAGSCTAVGSTSNPAGQGQLTLAEHWDGSKWAIQATPAKSGSLFSNLQGVSCSSDVSCTAAGFSTSTAEKTRTLAEFWNGSTWAIQATPSPAGTQYSQLSAVSCDLTGNCTAAGYYITSSGPDLTLAERADAPVS